MLLMEREYGNVDAIPTAHLAQSHHPMTHAAHRWERESKTMPARYRSQEHGRRSEQ